MTETSPDSDELPLEVQQVEIAMRNAVQKALRESIRLGVPAHFWENGRLIEVPPKELHKYLDKPSE